MGAATLRPAVSSDDGHWLNNRSEIFATDQVAMGNGANGFVRFPACPVPPGSAIVSAVPRFVAQAASDTTALGMDVSFAAADNPAAPTTKTEALAFSRTSSVAWDTTTAWVSGSSYDGPGLAAALQEIVDRAGYVQGNALLLLLVDRASGRRNAQSVDQGYANRIALDVEWTDPEAANMPPLAFEFDFPAPSTPIAFAPSLAFEFDFPAPSSTSRYGRILTAVRRIPVGRELTVVRRLPIGREVTVVRRIPAEIGRVVTAVRRIPVEIGRVVTAVRRILDHDPLGVVLTARRRIPSDGSALRRSVPWAAAWADDGAALDIMGATISGDRDSLAWSCDLSLADAAAYAACTPGRRLTLTLAGRAWTLLIEGRTRQAACGTREYTATARTVSCLLDAPYAALLTQSWPAVTAKAAAVALAALAGLALDWQVVDWTLPAGRLTAEAETPAALIARLAASCGAVAIPDPAGGVIVRYAYPVGVPEMATATPVAVLSDDEDVETLGETFVAGAGYNAVTVVDNRETAEAFLAWELDSDRNAGRSTFPPGEPCYVRVYHETEYSLKTSLGLLELVTADIEEAVDKVVGFADADSADLGGLVIAVTSCVWYGPDLGTLVPSGGGTVVASAGAGFSVAAVSYRTRYDLWRLTAPAVADAYTIQLGLEEVEP